MRFELFIATRYLRAKRRQAFIGVITGISVAGVAAGVASLIVALAINNGFRQDLQQRLLGSTAHVSLLRVQSDGIQDWRPLLDKLSKQPHVVAVAPAIYEQVLISRGPRARGAVLKGMLPQYERRVSDLLKTVTLGSAAALEGGSARETHGASPQEKSKARAAGGGVRGTHGASAQEKSKATAAGGGARPTHAESPDDLAGVQQRVAAMPPIILGKDMAEQIGAGVGSVVLVTSPQGELTPFGMVPKYLRFKVVGIFNSGFFDYDSSWAFTRLSDAQQLFGLGDLISVIEFKLDDIYVASDVARQLEQAAGQGFISGVAARAGGHVHHDRADCIRSGAEHPDLAHHDGDGEDEGHRRTDVARDEKSADSPRVYCAGRVDRRDRNRGGASARVCDLLGGWALPLYFALSRSLFHRLCSVCATAYGWSDRNAGFDWSFICGDGLSVVVGVEDSTGGGAAV